MSTPCLKNQEIFFHKLNLQIGLTSSPLLCFCSLFKDTSPSSTMNILFQLPQLYFKKRKKDQQYSEATIDTFSVKHWNINKFFEIFLQVSLLRELHILHRFISNLFFQNFANNTVSTLSDFVYI